MSDKEKRFNELLAYYAKAAHLADSLLDSGILESKVKVQDFGLFQRSLTVVLSSELREAEKQSSHYIVEDIEAVRLAEAYFAELEARGSEWQHADLKDLFQRYLTDSKNSIES